MAKGKPNTGPTIIKYSFTLNFEWHFCDLESPYGSPSEQVKTAFLCARDQLQLELGAWNEEEALPTFLPDRDCEPETCKEDEVYCSLADVPKVERVLALPLALELPRDPSRAFGTGGLSMAIMPSNI